MNVIRFDGFDPKRVLAGFSTREGGVSEGPFRSLNLASRDDDPGAVAENMLRFARACQLSKCPPAMQRQVHGSQVTWVGGDDGPGPSDVRGMDGDALLTRQAGVPLAVLVADCVPILLWDPDHGVVGAVHAGWRGTALGIAGVALAEMRERAGTDPGAVKVAIGPAICGDCYEVGPEVAGALAAHLAPDDYLASGDDERERVDLRRANRALLMADGVPPDAIGMVGGCTACEEHFYSYRCDGPRTGRQMGVIQLR